VLATDIAEEKLAPLADALIATRHLDVTDEGGDHGAGRRARAARRAVQLGERHLVETGVTLPMEPE